MNIKNEKRKIKEVDGKEYIFDYLRKKYILLTPEEIVRQNFLDYLIETCLSDHYFYRFH